MLIQLDRINRGWYNKKGGTAVSAALDIPVHATARVVTIPIDKIYPAHP
jgi:hypothetical protein